MRDPAPREAVLATVRATWSAFGGPIGHCRSHLGDVWVSQVATVLASERGRTRVPVNSGDCWPLVVGTVVAYGPRNL